MTNLYGNTARLYDLRTQVLEFPDVDFFAARAAKAGGPVLELACGAEAEFAERR